MNDEATTHFLSIINNMEFGINWLKDNLGNASNGIILRSETLKLFLNFSMRTHNWIYVVSWLIFTLTEDINKNDF